MEYTDIRYSDITTCIDFLSARAAQLEDGWSPNELCEGEQSHAYIIKHPIETQLTSCDGIHWHQVQWHYYVYWFCECQSSTTGGRMVSKWIVWGRAVSCLHNQAPNWNTIDSLWWNTLTSGTVTFLHVLILWVPEQHNWRRNGLQWIVWGRAVSCLHNQSPNWNTIWLLAMEYTDIKVQWHYYVYWFCECQSSTTGGRMVSNELCEGEQSHAYIIKQPIETQLAPCDGIHWHQYSDITTCIDSVSARAGETGGRMVSKWIVWGRAVSCLHNQAPNLNTIDSLWWNTLTSGTVTFLHVLILWVPELENWGTDGLQMNCVGESSLMLT